MLRAFPLLLRRRLYDTKRPRRKTGPAIIFFAGQITTVLVPVCSSVYPLDVICTNHVPSFHMESFVRILPSQKRSSFGFLSSPLVSRNQRHQAGERSRIFADRPVHMRGFKTTSPSISTSTLISIFGSYIYVIVISS